MKLIELTVDGWIEELGSDSPAPGGGSVAALAGSMSAALATMVANLTETEDRSEFNPILEEGLKIKQELKLAIDEDTYAFKEVFAGFQMPKSTEEEKKARSAAIQAGMKKAANIPFGVAKSCVKTMGFCKRMLEIGNQNALSDSGVGVLMAYSGFRGAIYNVNINIPTIKDAEFVAKMKAERDSLIVEAEKLYAEASALAAEKLGYNC